jgi:Rrf2 family transcriptional regulator, iron-sulfur cluster assembly transcription factor
MILLSRRSMLGIAAVVDIAIHGRLAPVAAKLLAARHTLPPRHLETLLQAFVKEGILKGVRGPRGGYQLAQERRKISAGDVVRAAMSSQGDDDVYPAPDSKLVDLVVAPSVRNAGDIFLTALDAITIDELCKSADEAKVFGVGAHETVDFAI